ncbi:hypothetical protein V6N11_012192 [Hibiscus sabdariffa]|uniref:Uncharacterized protein n=2 Tax=Hibiscus sabdariffa TaxID=183260 RepID=A0ABR1ZQI8_9ROSI
MQKKGKDFQQYGICHRLFNFIMNSLIGRGNGEERVNSKTEDDDSDPAVMIHFKRTEELEYWPPADKLGSSVRPAAEGGTAMTKSNEFNRPSGKEFIQGEGSVGSKKITIPITNRGGQNEKKKKKKAGPTPIQPDGSELTLTGLGLNINEVSEKYIEKTKRKMTENFSFMQREES